MIKKISIAVLCVFGVCAARAENWVRFTSAAVEEMINISVSPERRQAAADEYQKNMDAATGWISVSGMYKVCIAGGMDIKTDAGYNNCRTFVNTLVEKSNLVKMTASAENCATLWNGVWAADATGKTHQCIGRDGHKLVYSKSCRNKQGKCVDAFQDLQTQGASAREFISAWGNKNNMNLTCHATADINKVGQDYIQCSAGGMAYEFEFDDLNQNPGEKSSRSQATAMCKLFGGEIVTTGDSVTDNTWFSCTAARDVCEGGLRSLAMAVGHTVQYQGHCRISRKVDAVAGVFLNQIDGVDSRVFYNAGVQTRIDDAKPMVEQYLRGKFPGESYIGCESAIKKLTEREDYVMTCTVGTRQVDFVFDDLTEGKNVAAAAGLAGMRCIVAGGEFAGKTCKFIDNAAQCLKLNTEVAPNVARWDDKMGACVLADAKRYNSFKNGVWAVGGTVVGLAIGAVAGVAAGTVILATVVVDVVFEGAYAVLNRIKEINPQHRAVQFLEDTKDCADSSCAYLGVMQHTARLKEILSDLNGDVQAQVVEHYAYLTSLLTQEEFNMAVNSSGLTFGDSALKASGAALFVIALVGNPDKALTEALEKVPHLATKIDNLGDVIKMANAAGITDLSKLTRADDVADAARAASRIDVYDIGSYSNGWTQRVIGGDSRFKVKKISYAGEADEVRRALEANPNAVNQAYLGVVDDYIVITYKSDLSVTRPIFDRYVAGQTVDAVSDAARAASKVDDVVNTIPYSADLERSFLNFISDKVNRSPHGPGIQKEMDYMVDLSEFNQWNRLTPETQHRLLDLVSPSLTNYGVEVRGMNGNVLNMHDVKVENYLHVFDDFWVDRNAVESRPWNQQGVDVEHVRPLNKVEELVARRQVGVTADVARKTDEVVDGARTANMGDAAPSVPTSKADDFIEYTEGLEDEALDFVMSDSRFQRDGFGQETLDDNFVFQLDEFENWSRLSYEQKMDLLDFLDKELRKKNFKIVDKFEDIIEYGDFKVEDLFIMDYNAHRF